MSLRALTQKLPENPISANLLARFLQSFAAQISFIALCSANYQVDRCLARWLLCAMIDLMETKSVLPTTSPR